MRRGSSGKHRNPTVSEFMETLTPEQRAEVVARNPHLFRSTSTAPAAASRVVAEAPATKVRGPNKTEDAYARSFLDPRKASGEITDYHFEAFRVRVGMVGERCWYVVDYAVFLPDGGLEFHEVKGGRVWDDAKVKFQAAARLYPSVRKWVWARRNKGAWTVREFTEEAAR